MANETKKNVAEKSDQQRNFLVEQQQANKHQETHKGSQARLGLQINIFAAWIAHGAHHQEGDQKHQEWQR